MPMIPPAISFLDIETTGTSVTHNRIIEIGIIRVENNKVVKKYNSLVNPESRIDEFITNMTGIRQKDVEKAPTFYDIKDELREILKDSVIAAHNVRFDYGFLRNEFKRHEITFSQKHFCTVKLARALYPGLPHYNLDSIIANFSIHCKNRHRAYDDALVIWKFFKQALKKFPLEDFEKSLAIAMKRPSLPQGITEEDLDMLPESPGVYLFFGETKAPLYIGKSVNIRERVLSHFVNDHNASKEMSICQQVKRIETQITAGELGALFLESTLIKTMQPLYNRQLRYSRHLLVLEKAVTEEGYYTFLPKEMKEIDINNLESIAGVFKSQKQMKDFLLGVADENNLCHKLLGLEKTKKACFRHGLGKCRGACVGKENVIRYNMRFDMAFIKHHIKPWPFKGPVLIHEKGEMEEYFMFDKWCFLGSFKTESDFRDKHREYIFDYDTYKILTNYIKEEKNRTRIKVI